MKVVKPSWDASMQQGGNFIGICRACLRRIVQKKTTEASSCSCATMGFCISFHGGSGSVHGKSCLRQGS